MNEDASDAPLSRRVPGSTRAAPGQSVRPVFSDTDVYRIQAAINAEQAHAEAPSPPEPNTEPLARVTGSEAETKHVGSPLANTERGAKSARRTKTPRVDESLRAAKALQASAELRAAERPRTAKPRATKEIPSATGRLRPEEPVVVPEPVRAEEPVVVPEPVRAEEPVVVSDALPAEEPVVVSDALPAEEPVAVAEPVRVKQPVIATEPDVLPEPRTAWPQGEPPPGTIGWLWPESTATRGGSPRWQRLGWWAGSLRRSYRTAALVAVGVVVLAAGGLALGMLLHSSPAGTSAHAATSDPRPSTHAPVNKPKKHAAKSARAGGSAASGSRAPRVHDHAVQTRIRTGRQLLGTGTVSASAAAQSDLVAGAVDSRLLLVIKAIASVEPVDVLGFADPGPGAGTPFRQMTLAETDQASSVSAPAYLHQMIAVLQAHATFPAVHASQVTLADGQKAVQVEYAAPSQPGG